MKLHWLVPVTLLLGCPADNGGGTGGSDSSSSSTGDSATTMTTITSATTMTTMESMTGTVSATTDTATTAMTTDMTTADSSGTTDATTTDATTTDATTTGTDSGSSTTGPVVPGTYPPCDFSDPENPTCESMDDTCWQYPPESDMDTFHAWCAPACEMFMPDNCPAIESGDAVVECSMLPGNPCALNCGMGETCPDGMECYDVPNFPISRCVWNIPQ